MLERTVNALYLLRIIYVAYIPHNEKLFDLWSFLTVRNNKGPQKSTVITTLYLYSFKLKCILKLSMVIKRAEASQNFL